jgi:hypothetical protein
MAKELPYFQFEPAEYLTKDISFCSLSAQGLFINICSYYWQRQCDLTKEQFLRRFNYLTEFEELIKEGVIDIENEKIKIKFLDIQYLKATEFSKEQSRKGSLGGRPKKPTETQTKTELKPNESQTKAIREEEIKENNIIENKENNNNFLLEKETKEFFNEIEVLPLNNQEEKRKKVAPKKENETIIATDEFLQLWNEYKSYRVAKKKTFKFANLRFEQMAFDKLFKLSNQNFETARKIVTQTIENNWEGLFELKENKIVEPIVAGRQTLSTIQSNSDWSMIENPYVKK